MGYILRITLISAFVGVFLALIGLLPGLMRRSWNSSIPGESVKKRILILIISVALVGVVSAKTTGERSLHKQLSAIGKALKAGKVAQAAELSRSFVPTEEQLGEVLVHKEHAALVMKWLDDVMPEDEQGLANIFFRTASHRVVSVKSATTEDMARRTPAGREFSGGAVRLAKKGLLRPGVRFYTVRIAPPGDENGIRYAMFFKHEQGWKYAGKVWQAEPEDSGPEGQLTHCKSNLKHIATALDMFVVDHGRPPENLAQLTPTYLRQLPKCPTSDSSDDYSQTYKVQGKNYTIGCRADHTVAGCKKGYPKYSSRNRKIRSK